MAVSYLLFLQEQIKGIIIITKNTMLSVSNHEGLVFAIYISVVHNSLILTKMSWSWQLFEMRWGLDTSFIFSFAVTLLTCTSEIMLYFRQSYY